MTACRWLCRCLWVLLVLAVAVAKPRLGVGADLGDARFPRFTRCFDPHARIAALQPCLWSICALAECGILRVRWDFLRQGYGLDERPDLGAGVCRVSKL